MTLSIPNVEAHLVEWAHFHHSTNPSAPFGDGWREVVTGWADKVPTPTLKQIRGLYTCARLALLTGKLQEIHNPRMRQAVQIAQSRQSRQSNQSSHGSMAGDDVPVYTIRRKRGGDTI